MFFAQEINWMNVYGIATSLIGSLILVAATISDSVSKIVNDSKSHYDYNNNISVSRNLQKNDSVVGVAALAVGFAAQLFSAISKYQNLGMLVVITVFTVFPLIAYAVIRVSFARDQVEKYLVKHHSKDEESH